jgi:hypothetical protein
MGKRVLAAFGVLAPRNGVLASGLSAAPTSADAATSFTAERTGSSEDAQPRAPYRQAVAEGGRLAAVRLEQGPPADQGARERSAPGHRHAVPEPAAGQGRAGAPNRHLERPHGRRPARRKGLLGYVTMNPLGLGQFMSDRAALDRHKGPPQPLHRPCTRRQPRPTPRPRPPSDRPAGRPRLNPCSTRAAHFDPVHVVHLAGGPEAMSPTITLHPRKHA